MEEETAQRIVLGELTKVQTGHWIGRNPGGMIEDFHAVRLVYRATCPDPTEPEVLDRGGSTASARWVGLDSWMTLPWTANWMMILTELLPELGASSLSQSKWPGPATLSTCGPAPARL